MRPFHQGASVAAPAAGGRNGDTTDHADFDALAGNADLATVEREMPGHRLAVLKDQDDLRHTEPSVVVDHGAVEERLPEQAQHPCLERANEARPGHLDHLHAVTLPLE